MKLLPEQEKDNFAKLNPAQEVLSIRGCTGVGSHPLARRDTRTNTWQFIAISALCRRLVRRKRWCTSRRIVRVLLLWLRVGGLTTVYGENMHHAERRSCGKLTLILWVIDFDGGELAADVRIY